MAIAVDIWPGLGTEQAAADTRQIQAAVRARQVGYWGQEIDFGKWHAARRGTGRPSLLEGLDFARWSRLPLGKLPQPYLEAARVATQLFASKLYEDAARNPGSAATDQTVFRPIATDRRVRRTRN